MIRRGSLLQALNGEDVGAFLQTTIKNRTKNRSGSQESQRSVTRFLLLKMCSALIDAEVEVRTLSYIRYFPLCCLLYSNFCAVRRGPLRQSQRLSSECMA